MNYHQYFYETIKRKIVAKNFLPWELELCPIKITRHKHTITTSHTTENNMTTQNNKAKGTCDALCQYMILISDWVSRGMPITAMANTKVENTTSSKILNIKNNSSEPVNIVLIPNLDAFLDLKTGPEEFYEHYQNLYCNKCDFIYNPPSHIIYTIPEEDKPINNYILESESIFNPNSNSDNDNDKNNSSSFAQYNKKNNGDSDSNSNAKTYIYSNNNKDIIPECAHDTDARFDLRYSEKNAIKLEPHLCTCIDLKVTLEILATTMVQLIFRSSLVKKRINIRKGIINTEYIGNIIVMLQNDLEKTYIIEPNKKIAQAIFLPLMKVAQLVSVRNRKELEITVRKIQVFGSTNRIDVPVNMAKEEVIDKGEIISICQPIFIPLYDRYMIRIERKVKDQIQIFETETKLCKSEKIGLVNLHIPAKNHSYIKILIYNNMGELIEIPKGTTIGYLITKIEDQLPDIIPDFSQLCEYLDITSQTIYGQEKYYLLQPEQLEQINLENLDLL
ncbi:hypothetical protein G9A89_021924 [Geosiphon pyriformis]|nr:hypothetical protein G9A89_021924 [Geosiphon pyriformis]